jgi:hypothetical protein
MDLGADPRKHIVYPGGNSFYISEEVEDALQAHGVRYTAEQLEDLFFPFLEAHIRRILRNFKHDTGSCSPWSAFSPEDLLVKQQSLHSLDKRRLHYLRCGRVDIGRLDGRAWGFLNVLLGKSRDEIEHTIESMEMNLRPTEMRAYIFTAFHLQSYFTAHLLRNQPAALDPEKVDEALLEEVCRLNRNPDFFKGVEGHDTEKLHPYLAKYIILYFDAEWDMYTPWKHYIEEILRQRRFSPHKRSPQPAITIQEACFCLGISPEELNSMNQRDLTRVYRRRAKEVHPDKGGDHDAFVKVTEAYEFLVLKKR